jgi:hypothetical protein
MKTKAAVELISVMFKMIEVHMNTARSAQADGKLIPDIFLMHDIPQ